MGRLSEWFILNWKLVHTIFLMTHLINLWKRTVSKEWFIQSDVASLDDTSNVTDKVTDKSFSVIHCFMVISVAMSISDFSNSIGICQLRLCKGVSNPLFCYRHSLIFREILTELNVHVTWVSPYNQTQVGFWPSALVQKIVQLWKRVKVIIVQATSP